MKYEIEHVKWEVLPPARKVHAQLHAHLSADMAKDSVDGLRKLLCAYFSERDNCDGKAIGVFPMGSTPCGDRAFKVRWKVPGAGKSGGLRLAIVAKCPSRHIVVAAAWPRDTDPDDADFAAAMDDVRAD